MNNEEFSKSIKIKVDACKDLEKAAITIFNRLVEETEINSSS